jgi:hypothetical protein
MRVYAVAAVLVTAVTAAHADIKPTDPSTPLFKVYEPKFTRLGENPRADIDDPPLLVIRSVRDLILAGDKKGVMIGLTPADTKKFAEMTRRFDKRYLVFVATDELMAVYRITAPIEDGYIGFKHPEEPGMAKYLRRRFRIGEFE